MVFKIVSHHTPIHFKEHADWNFYEHTMRCFGRLKRFYYMELVKQARENNAYLAGYSCHDSFSVCYIFILFFFVSLFSLLILDIFSRKQVARLRICAIEVATPPFETTTIPQTLNKPVSVDVLWHYFCCRHPASVVPKYKIGELL